MAKHVIVIYDDSREGEDEDCRITPAALIARKDDEVEFWNTGGEEVTVKFKGVSPLNDNNFQVGLLKRVLKRVKIDEKPGCNLYWATCKSGKKTKGSKPIIIIYD